MIFITGATGLLGNCVVRELAARGIATRVLRRRQTPSDSLEGLDVDIVEGDLDDTDALRAGAEGCRAVIHSAALIHIGWTRLDASRRVNVAGTQRVVDACLAARARLVHISTVDTLPAASDADHPIDELGRGGVAKPPCAYVVSKREAEDAVRAAIAERGLDAVILHPGFMLGPYDWKPSSGRMFQQVVRAPIVAAPPGGCSVCDVRAVASAVVNAVDRGGSGENYILAGENMSYRDLWTRMLATAGRRRRVYRLGSGVRWLGRAIDGVNRALARTEGDVNGAAIAMGALYHYYDSSKAQRQLDYRNPPIAETLSDAWEWLRRD